MSANPNAQPDPLAAMQEILAALDAGADHFGVLRVSADAAPQQVRDQYFRLAKVVHPDLPQFVSHPKLRADATRAFQAITAAHAVLSDPAKRREYIESRLPRLAEAAASATTPVGGSPALERPANADIARIYLHRGRQQLARRDWAGAQEALEPAVAVLQDKKELADGKVMLGWAMFNNMANPEQDRIERSKSLWQDVAVSAAGTPFHAQAAYYLALWHKLHGEMKPVMALLDKCLELDPKHIEAAREKRLLERRRTTGSFPDMEKTVRDREQTRRASKIVPAAVAATGKQKVALERKPTFLERLFGKK